MHGQTLSDDSDAHTPAVRAFLCAVVVGSVVIGVLSVPVVGQQAAPGMDTHLSLQQSNATANSSGSTPPDAGGSENDGYSLTDLRQSGTEVADAPTSVRLLGDNGAISLRRKPAAPFRSEYQWIGSGETVQSRNIQLYSTRFGDIDERNVTVHIVYYQTEERSVRTDNGTVRKTVPTNVSEQKVDVTLAEGYFNQSIKLRPKYDEKWEVAMWVTDGGERIDGVAWNFDYQAVPSSAAAVGIDSQGDLWSWAGWNILLPAIVGLLFGAFIANQAVKKAGKGPMLGPFGWGIIIFILLVAVISAGYFQTAVILRELPWVLGAFIALVGFVAYLEIAGPATERVEFVKDTLDEAKSVEGDAIKDSVLQSIKQKTAVRREDGTLGLPKTGIRPFIARLFADPATVDDIDLKTQIECEGDISRKYVADPEADDVLVHEPAHLRLNPRPLKKKKPALPADAESAEEGRSDHVSDPGYLDRLNGQWLLAAAFASVVPYVAIDAALGLQSIGILAGILCLAVVSTEAVDGTAGFEPAPIHYRPARATITNLATDYDDASTLDKEREKRWKAQTQTAQDVIDLERHRDETVTQRLTQKVFGYDYRESPDDGDRRTPEERPAEAGDASEYGDSLRDHRNRDEEVAADDD